MKSLSNKPQPLMCLGLGWLGAMAPTEKKHSALRKCIKEIQARSRTEKEEVATVNMRLLPVSTSRMLVSSCKYTFPSSFFRMTVKVDLGVQKDDGRMCVISKKRHRYLYVFFCNKSI